MSYIQIPGSGAAGTGGIAVSLSGNNTSGALALVSSGTLRLAGGNNITLSQNGQSVTISGAANAGGGTLSVWEPLPIAANVAFNSTRQLGQGSLWFYPLMPQCNISATQMMNLYNFSVSTSSNSSFAAVFSQSVGVYTLTGSTLNLITASSGATNFQFTNTSNNSTASLNNIRAYTIPLPFNATPGNYWIGIVSSTSTTNANWVTMNYLALSAVNSTLGGTLGQATTAAQAFVKGWGVYTAQTGALPAAVNISADISSGSSLAALQVPYMQFQGF